MDLGWKPKGPLDLVDTRKFSRIEVLKEFQTRLSESLKDASFAHQLAKARQSAYSFRKRQAHPYKMGDMIWLDEVMFRDVIARHQERIG